MEPCIMADEQKPIGVEDFLEPVAEDQAVEDEQAVNPEDLLIEDDEPAEQEDETVDETAEDEAKDETETEVEPVPMPVSWSKEDAEAWKALPPEAQAIVARREGERDKYVRE